jgi:hypothetical protein
MAARLLSVADGKCHAKERSSLGLRPGNRALLLAAAHRLHNRPTMEAALAQRRRATSLGAVDSGSD